LQVTSPIRRYPDLLAHWQLKAALRGEAPPFTAPELASILADVGTASQEMTKLERESQSYWVAHYFRNAVAMDADATWQATFLSWFKQEAGLGRALLIDVGLEVMVKIARPVTPGSNLIVRCVAADPASRTLRLDEVVGGAVFGCNENSRAAVAG
jgi:exoribonuclease II